ncbi:MAG: CPBP family glutamic-type intramembrane protease [Leucobacter sp.]
MTSAGPEQPRPAMPPAQGQPSIQQPAPAAPPFAQPAPPPAQNAAPQEWAWAPPQLQTVETEPLEYHRLLRGVSGYRWWKPLLLLLLSGLFFGVLSIALGIAFIPVLMFGDPEYAADLAAGTSEILDTQRPVSVLLSLLSVIVMLPSVMLAMLVMGMRPVGRVWSVATRIRWGLLLRLLAAGVLSVVVMNAVGIGIGVAMDPASLTEPATGEGSAGAFDPNAALLSLLLVLVLVPLQSTAEEVVFRGLFMQVLGSWLKNPWFGILIPSVGFALAHIYDIWGLVAVGMLGGVAAWLTWRTGGIEGGIAIHVANNLIVFALMASGITGETAQTSDGSGPSGVIGEAAGLVVFVWLTLRIFRRGGHGRERIDLMRVPVAVDPWVAYAPGQPMGQPFAPAPDGAVAPDVGAVPAVPSAVSAPPVFAAPPVAVPPPAAPIPHAPQAPAPSSAADASQSPGSEPESPAPWYPADPPPFSPPMSSPQQSGQPSFDPSSNPLRSDPSHSGPQFSDPQPSDAQPSGPLIPAPRPSDDGDGASRG